MRTAQIAGLAAVLMAAAATPALAQKSKDTLRLAINDPFPILSPHYYQVDEAGNFHRGIIQTLLAYDEHKQKLVPQLGKSWKRVSPTVIEVELFEDRTFHNGDKFDADDVVDTMNFAKDPKYQFEIKTRHTWVKSVEKLGPYKVRIESEQVNAMDFGLLAYRAAILDSKVLNPLEDKSEYGKTAIGTGPYRLVSLDKNAGVVIERFDGYKGDPAYGRAPIKRIMGIPMPDKQTQVANLMAGNIDMLRNVTPETADELVKSGKFAESIPPTASFVFAIIDAAGRAGNKALTDVRVRKAMWMAVDRDKIIKYIVPGGQQGVAKKMNALCFDFAIGCRYSAPLPPYDPAEAKRLLAEAGYPNGFDLTYDVFIPMKAIGEAIAGDLLKVGIRTAVVPMPFSLYRKKQANSELQMVSLWSPTSGHPDVGNTLDLFFNEPRDYARDPEMNKLMEAGLGELDPEKRAQIYEKALNLNNEQMYVWPFSSMPIVFVHTKDIEIKENTLSAGDNNVTDYFWK
jgi:peptide/nickel transport system substrate-binding protein